MEKTLVLFKPSAVQRALVGTILARFEQKGLRIMGMKMMQLDDAILAEHYAHLVAKPFYPSIKESMEITPVIACCLEGLEAVKVVRAMTGATNGRNAEVGTIRGDYSMSTLMNLVHSSDSVETARIEIERFFSPDEIFNYPNPIENFYYTDDEL